jgi:hypothetical protein
MTNTIKIRRGQLAVPQRLTDAKLLRGRRQSMLGFLSGATTTALGGALQACKELLRNVSGSTRLAHGYIQGEEGR